MTDRIRRAGDPLGEWRPEPLPEKRRPLTRAQAKRIEELKAHQEEWRRIAAEHEAEWREEDERAYVAALRESKAENLSDRERRLLEKYPVTESPLNKDAMEALERWSKARRPAEEDADP